MNNNILQKTKDLITYPCHIFPGFSFNVSVANRILDLDVVVPENANTTGLLGVRNGDIYDDFILPDGSNITLNDSNIITLSDIHKWGLECEYYYNDVIMGAMASKISSLTIVCSTVYSAADQRKHQKVRVPGLCAGNSRGPVNFPHKWAVTRKVFPFVDVIM